MINYLLSRLVSLNYPWLILACFGDFFFSLYELCIWFHLILQFKSDHFPFSFNHIGGVMVSVLASNVVYRGFESWSGQTKDNKIGICCFSAKHAALRIKSKDCLGRNQDNVSEWADMSIHRLLFQWTRRVGLVQSGPHHHLNDN
jgi:hypothetical protein